MCNIYRDRERGRQHINCRKTDIRADFRPSVFRKTQNRDAAYCEQHKRQCRHRG
jgi:hypothetical protein